VKAVVYREYGTADVLEYRDIEKPTPAADEILIQVVAASLNPRDWHFMRGTPYLVRLVAGLRRPKVTVLGADLAGRVEAVGANVTRFKPGDEVFGAKSGAFAEYVCAPADQAVALKPTNVTFEQAAAVPIAAITALQALRDHGKAQPGHEVLINGASGGVGTYAVQIAKAFGAHVTGVCSTTNVDLVRSLGADRVVDYTQEDFTRLPQRYHVILDCAGNRALRDCRRVLDPDGIYVSIGGGGPDDGNWIGPLVGLLELLLVAPFASQKLGSMLAKLGPEDLDTLRGLIEAGKVTPVIDRRYTLAEVPAAVRYLERGHARGKVVIQIV
jgi:NADPH:quinone reductase-like Zn-dependent oxidoreductase